MPLLADLFERLREEKIYSGATPFAVEMAAKEIASLLK